MYDINILFIRPSYSSKLQACVNRTLLPFEFSLGNGKRVELIADTRALIIKAEVNQWRWRIIIYGGERSTPLVIPDGHISPDAQYENSTRR